MKPFCTPQVEIIVFSVADIITTSYEAPIIPIGDPGAVSNVNEMDLSPAE